MKTFQTKNGRTVQVSDQDYPNVIQYRWSASKEGYVYRSTKAGIERLHRFILGAKPGEVVDHADRNPLNNTRENIRITTTSNNRANSKKMLRKGRASSKFKGVTRINGRKSRRWQSGIAKDRKWYFLGTFKTSRAAAKAYDAAAVKLYGPFALTNKMLYGI